MRRRVPDISKIQNAVGWEPTACLEKIIGDVIRHQMTSDAIPGASMSDANAISGTGQIESARAQPI
jgi:hypothetical protein